MKAINRTRDSMLGERIELAERWFARGNGLIGRKRLRDGEGMLFKKRPLEPFMWMHMLFMSFAIDVLFLDGKNVVIELNPNLRPWRVSSLVVGAHKVLELPMGTCERTSTKVGDRISFGDET
jgi:uncharacterized membrane protein (UPF0127 family)